MWYDDSLFTETMQTIVIMNIINDYNDYIWLQWLLVKMNIMIYIKIDFSMYVHS